jgi:hypothetical protein
VLRHLIATLANKVREMMEAAEPEKSEIDCAARIAHRRYFTGELKSLTFMF